MGKTSVFSGLHFPFSIAYRRPHSQQAASDCMSDNRVPQ
jgi:hypothetical protein